MRQQLDQLLVSGRIPLEAGIENRAISFTKGRVVIRYYAKRHDPIGRKTATVMQIALPTCVVRDWRPSDVASLARHANDRRIWRNLRDAFPHPYDLAHAEAFITMAMTMSPVTFFAISIDDEAVGGIGYTLHQDVERISAEIGYWLGAAFWGRGTMTSALDAVTRSAFAQHEDLRRIYAVPYSWSAASMRVLEKVGYRLEGRMRQSAIKDGQVTDQLLYAILREELPLEGVPPPQP